MVEYKVVFDNNKAVAATKFQKLVPDDAVRLHREGDKKLLDWLVVYGDDEQDAMQLADNIVTNYWGTILK